MESTGVYWIALFQILEERGFERKLVNPRHLKTVQGRKTDVLDCQWIQQLHTWSTGRVISFGGSNLRASQLPASASDAGGVRVAAYPAHAERPDVNEREVTARDPRRNGSDGYGHHSRDPRR
mgnify:CR=1 FL=1